MDRQTPIEIFSLIQALSASKSFKRASISQLFRNENMKLLLLDKDGTLISPNSGAKFVEEPWD